MLFIGTFDAEATVLTFNRIDRKERDSFGCLVANQELLDDSTVTFNTSVNSAGFNFDDDKNDMKIFDVVDTKLTRLPNEIFNTFISIKAMQLENTGIETWKREYLEGANVLYLLEIIRSSITYFPSDAFAEAPELSVLAIINSKMNSINPDMFANLPKLESLGLCEHDFSGGLPTDAFASLAKSLKYLDLQATRYVTKANRRGKNKLMLTLDLHKNSKKKFDKNSGRNV